MKKLYFLLFSLAAGSSAYAQTVDNAGMETWRSGGAGSGPVVSVQAPTQWFGFDSLVVEESEALMPLFLSYSPTDLHAQIFQENTIKHSGAASAKIMTVKQDTIGLFAGVLSNAKPNFDVGALIATMDFMQALSFSGGTPVTNRIKSVSAWVQYTAGKDSTGSVGLDSGSLTVSVYKHILSLGIDSLVGFGSVNIGPSTSFQQVTANVIYTDSVDGADTVRVLFSSSGQSDVSDSSTLYVDDVTMEYVVENGVKNVNGTGNEVNVYPNPASGILYMDAKGNEGAEFQLYAVNGQVVATHTLKGNNEINISALAEGLYFYTITGKDNMVQRGKVSVIK